MELFLPSLICILLVAFFIFMVLPRMGPMVLAVVALIALISVEGKTLDDDPDDYYIKKLVLDSPNADCTVWSNDEW